MNEDKLLAVVTAIKKKKADDESKKSAIVVKYKGKEKVKPLSTAERLDRIEELLGLK